MIFVLKYYAIDDSNTHKIRVTKKECGINKEITYDDFADSIVRSRIKLEDIEIADKGFKYNQVDGNETYVSPSYFMLSFIQQLKCSGEELYTLYETYQTRFGNEWLDNLSFIKAESELSKEYKEEKNYDNSYDLKRFYTEKYLRTIILLNSIELNLDGFINNLLEQYDYNFDKNNDSNYSSIKKFANDNVILVKQLLNSLKVAKKEYDIEVKNIHEKCKQILTTIYDIKNKANYDVIDRYNKQFSSEQKISFNELLNGLEDYFKLNILNSAYNFNLSDEYILPTTRALGLDEILYFRHPKDNTKGKDKYEKCVFHESDPKVYNRIYGDGIKNAKDGLKRKRNKNI